jgi:hypothetical protein
VVAAIHPSNCNNKFDKGSRRSISGSSLLYKMAGKFVKICIGSYVQRLMTFGSLMVVGV